MAEYFFFKDHGGVWLPCSIPPVSTHLSQSWAAGQVAYLELGTPGKFYQYQTLLIL